MRISFSSMLALVLAGSLAACGGIGTSPSQGVQPALQGAAQPAQASGASSHSRHTEITIDGSGPLMAAGLAVAPLKLEGNSTMGTFVPAGGTCGSGGYSGDPCPGASAPPYSTTSALTLNITAVTLTTPCAPPPGAPTPAPGVNSLCYIVAYENGYGPLAVMGPSVTPTGGTGTSFLALSGLGLEANATYTFYLEYVTALMTPNPTTAPTQSPPPTPTPTPTQAPPATPMPTATPCSGDGDGDHAIHSMDDGGGCCGNGDGDHAIHSMDDGGGCCGNGDGNHAIHSMDHDGGGCGGDGWNHHHHDTIRLRH